ncbi:hypothetical protein DL766_005176 [Monosporascus sp. MC13-8B]|uniref:FAD-binding domain-containing protein n=1 Tax=Monosporascus cannonballus TaxID=155416 RepID=A0ABY0HIK8_9PEZI|nr:hypothetical protein DL763_005704 [Monosporascus cannonballus]RYO94284.1 hypothetical protein DL762_000608 [Monosporascus cannonballus]RYP29877.1 hypothetical protein DL766_005176 [Monosporascus sp. MC13-8B]
MEPLLVKYAPHHDFHIRSSTKLVSGERKYDAVACAMRCLITGSNFEIRTKYIFGADSDRSKVAHSLGFSLDHRPSAGVAPTSS